jgi:hypothetical protein
MPPPVMGPLPTEVAELARKLGADGDCRVVQLSQLGRMSSGPSRRWMRFRALDEIETSATAFDWEARFGPLSCLTVVDRLSSEAAASELRFLGFRLSGAPADETALRKGQIMRYLAELAWAPDAILCNRSLEWQVREDGFRVSHPSAHGRISVEIQLDEAGRIGSVSAKDRPRMETGRFVDRPWRGSFADYRLRNGRWIPFRGEVGWHLDGNWHPVWTAELTDWRLE